MTRGLDGLDPDWLSTDAVLSANGRFVAFQSYASNLVAGDRNGLSDIFVYDREARTTVRVSVSSSGAESDGYSCAPAISGDGRYVVFASDATNLTPADTNGTSDVFLHDLHTRKTRRVSVARGQPDGPSRRPVVSDNGRYVAFESDATNLVPGDRNGVTDVFVRDLLSLTTTRISTTAGAESDAPSFAPSMSFSGRRIAFVSLASTFAGETKFDADVFVWDAATRTVALASTDAAGGAGGGEAATISRDGSTVVFESAASLRAEDTNPDRDVYAFRMGMARPDLVSVSSAGRSGHAWVHAPGFAPGTRIPADSFGASVSADGRHVAFVSLARGLVSEDVEGAEIYLRDLGAGATWSVTMDGAGRAAGRVCTLDPVLGRVTCPDVRARISADGQLVGVQTTAALARADANGQDDIYLVVAQPGRHTAQAADSAGPAERRKPEQSFSVR